MKTLNFDLNVLPMTTEDLDNTNGGFIVEFGIGVALAVLGLGITACYEMGKADAKN